ncbi:hypothetical protein QFZ96_000471 [Paraburkholderia youngii]
MTILADGARSRRAPFMYLPGTVDDTEGLPSRENGSGFLLVAHNRMALARERERERAILLQASAERRIL